MNASSKKDMRALIAGGLASLLILLSPGLPAYQAVAADFNSRGSAARPGGTPTPGYKAAPSATTTFLPALGSSAIPGTPAAATVNTTAAQSGAASAADAAASAATAAAAEAPATQAAGEKTTQDAVAEAGAALAQPNADKSGVLAKLFDRFRRKESAAVAAQTPGAAKAAAETPAPQLAPAGSLEAAPQTAVPSPTGDSDSKKAKHWYSNWVGLGFMPAMFVASAGVYQIGYESLGIGMQKAADVVLGSFTYVAQLGVVRIFGSMAGRILAPLVIEKLGLRTTYWGSMGLQLLTVSTMTAFFVWGFPALPFAAALGMKPALLWLMGLYGLSGFLSGMTYTAHDSIIPLLLQQDQAKLERFGTIEHLLLEILAVPTPIIMGLIVDGFGFLPAIIAYPIAMALAMTIVLAFVRFGEIDKAVRAADKNRIAGQPAAENVFKRFWRNITRGAVVVWKNIPLRITFATYALFMMFNYYIYSLFAAAYGKALVGDAFVSVQGFITGAYSAGGLVVTLMMLREQARLGRMKEPKDGSAPITPEQEKELLRKSMLRWMKWGTVGLSAFVLFAFPVKPLGEWVSLPGVLSHLYYFTLPAVALFFYGIPQVAANLKMGAYFRSMIPEKKDIPAAMGFFGAAGNLIYTLGLIGMAYLFKAYAGFTAFQVFLGLLVPIAAAYIYLTRKLDAASKPKA